MGLTALNARESYTVVDKSGRIITVLAGKPRDNNWDAIMAELAQKLKDVRGKMSFSKKQKVHKHGKFTSVSVGNSFGGGSQRPGMMAFYSTTNRLILMSLIAFSSFQRLVSFTNCVFECFAANTFGLYCEDLNTLFASNPKLTRWFRNSVFAGISFNMGPFTVAWPHTDSHNLAFGWCTITALGNFDPDKGGHLILWDLGLVTWFPPGSTILIPSTLLTHSNVPIQPRDECYSIIQYSSSGLFCWIYNSFMSDKDFLAKAMPEMKRRRAKDQKARWGNGLHMFSLWDDVWARFMSKQ
ncbi:hypothetical protein BT96DRAFT_828078 [Gymnopus androsaceus JB14]|uniref:Uncharacterized protein n=1 Tax=Gymnopus androsaceus JB14 TaxID=1447944 RepID=A0A6A4H951_9AGAR|nr:hypothetical protein BT96DRAFT_828078 [Gymnopus androsaceus JB14]